MSRQGCTDDVLRRREEIDKLDAELVRLLNERASVALELARVKATLGWEICDPERERQVLSQVENSNSGPFDHRSLKRIFRRIIWESRRIELRRQASEGAR
jgi:chorismate mutase